MADFAFKYQVLGFAVLAGIEEVGAGRDGLARAVGTKETGLDTRMARGCYTFPFARRINLP